MTTRTIDVDDYLLHQDPAEQRRRDTESSWQDNWLFCRTKSMSSLAGGRAAGRADVTQGDPGRSLFLNQ